MTKNKTKNDLSNEFKGVKYLLTSSMRTKLLLTIYEKPKNLDDLRKELKKPSATILHGLKELETINLIKKSQKHYSLTSHGILITTNMIKLIENWSSINKSKLFWNNHDLSGIPDPLLKNIYLLKEAKYINSTTSDLSKSFNTHIRLISNARELKIILPIYSENYFKQIINILNKRKLKKLHLVINEDILKSMNRNELFKNLIIENEKVTIKCLKKNLKIFLTYSNEFMSLTLFFNDGHYDDSQILIATDKNALKWAHILSKYY